MTAPQYIFYYDVKDKGQRCISVSQFRRDNRGYCAANIYHGYDIDECIRALIMNDPNARIVTETREKLNDI